VTGGVLRRALRLKEVERSEEGRKILKGNMWGRPSPRISDGGDESADSGVPDSGFRWRSEEECGDAQRRLLRRSGEEKKGRGAHWRVDEEDGGGGSDVVLELGVWRAAAIHVARRAGRREGGPVWGGDRVVRAFWFVDVFLIILFIYFKFWKLDVANRC
jgi:hypothetical protein